MKCNSADKKENLRHYNLHRMLEEINHYSTLRAMEKFQHNEKITRTGAFTHALGAFFRAYMLKKSFRDRLQGFYLSFSETLTNYLTYLKLLKLQNKI